MKKLIRKFRQRKTIKFLDDWKESKGDNYNPSFALLAIPKVLQNIESHKYGDFKFNYEAMIDDLNLYYHRAALGHDLDGA